MKTIKKGFYLEVTTWENDGDHVKTEAHRFDSLEEFEVALEVVKAMCDLHSDDSFLYYEDGVDKLLSTMSEKAGFDVTDLALDLVGTQYESNYYRVVDSYSSYFVDRDVVFPTITIVK